MTEDTDQQLAYHDERFGWLSDWDTSSIVIADLCGGLSHADIIGLDQMGHFGPHGCELVAETLSRNLDGIGYLCEVGSGFGGALRDITARLRALGHRPVPIGVELLIEHVRVARRIGMTSEVPGVSFIVADASQIPLRDESMTAVVAVGSFSHFQQPDMVLRDIARVLERDGLLVVIEEVSIAPDPAALRGEFLEQHPRGVFHFQTWEERDTQLRHAGLEMNERRFLADWAVDLLKARLGAIDLLRGTAERIYGAERVGIIERTLLVTVDMYRRGKVVPLLVVARKS